MAKQALKGFGKFADRIGPLLMLLATAFIGSATIVAIS
jgi:hypothetical protein